MPIILVLIAIPALLVGFVMVSSVAADIGAGTVVAAAAVLALLAFVVVEMMREGTGEHH